MINPSFPKRLSASYVVQKTGVGSKRLFWDRESREMDPCSRQLTGEERLWASILILAIQDYKGVHSNAEEECDICHHQEHPECFKVWFRKGEPYLQRANRSCTPHTIRECASRWIFRQDEDRTGGDGFTFTHICESLGIDPGYLRKNLNRAEYEAYWKDEASINRFLNFGHSGCDLMPIDPHPSSDAGCTDSTGPTDGASNVVGPLCGPEEAERDNMPR